MFRLHTYRRMTFATVVALFFATTGTLAQGADPQHQALNANAALRYYQAMLVQTTIPGYGVVPINEEDWALLKKNAPGNIDPKKADEIIAASSTLFKLIHQGAEVNGCDWGLHDIGFDTLLSYLNPMRQFGRLSDLRAQRRFATGDVDGAIDDLLVSFKLARHTAMDGFLISRLVSASIEGKTIEVAAAQLPSLTAAQLRRFNDGLNRLELSPYQADTTFIYMEKYTVVNWLGNKLKAPGSKDFLTQLSVDDKETAAFDALSQKQIQKMIMETAKIYDQAVQLYKLPYTQRLNALAAIDEGTSRSSNLIADTFLPSFSAAFNAIGQSQARYTMLQAAVAYRLGEDDIFNAMSDPGNLGKPFVLAEEGEGFTLTSKVRDKNSNEALVVRFGK